MLLKYIMHTCLRKPKSRQVIEICREYVNRYFKDIETARIFLVFLVHLVSIHSVICSADYKKSEILFITTTTTRGIVFFQKKDHKFRISSNSKIVHSQVH